MCSLNDRQHPLKSAIGSDESRRPTQLLEAAARRLEDAEVCNGEAAPAAELRSATEGAPLGCATSSLPEQLPGWFGRHGRLFATIGPLTRQPLA